MYQKEIENLDVQSVNQMLFHDNDKFVQIMESLVDRKLSVRDTGIDRKLLHFWKKQGVIPFTETDGWGRFNFVELCWIKLVGKFRSVGLSLDKIKELKEFFFEKNFINNLLSNQSNKINNLEEILPQNISSFFEIRSDSKIYLNAKGIEYLKDEKFSKFFLILLLTIMKRANICLYIDAEGATDVIDMNEVTNFNQFPKMLDIISEKSVVLINIRKIITDITGSEIDFIKKSNLSDMISSSSIDFLSTLFRENNVKEVTIRVTENGRPTVLMKKEMEISELQKEVRNLNKKGIFKDVFLRTRDGNVQYFEQTELIKL